MSFEKINDKSYVLAENGGRMRKIVFTMIFLSGLLVDAAQVFCDFYHDKHVQGVASSGTALYWVFTDVIVKSDRAGKILKKVPVHRMPGRAHHGGDPCFADNKLYIPYSGSGFNRALGNRKSHNYILQYSAELEFEKSFPIPELEYGAGCIAFADGHFFVAGGRPKNIPGNSVYEYDRDFKLVKKHEIPFDSAKGIQSLTTDGKCWYFGVYGKSPATFVTDMKFNLLGKWHISTAVGLLHEPDGRKIKIRSVKRKNTAPEFGGALLPLSEKHTKVHKLSQ